MKTIEERTYCYYSSVPIQRDAHLRHGKDVFHSEQARPTPRGLTLFQIDANPQMDVLHMQRFRRTQMSPYQYGESSDLKK